MVHMWATCKLKAESVFDKYLSAGILIVGQRGPLQICAKRNGTQGEIIAGIHLQAQKPSQSSVGIQVLEIRWWVHDGLCRCARNGVELMERSRLASTSQPS